MAEERVPRRLAVILAADVVGYSRLMDVDEEATLRTIKAHRRIIDGNLHALDDRSLGPSAKYIVGAYDVGQENSVETTPLEDPRQIHPWVQARVLELPSLGTSPQALLNMRHAVHREGVEQHAARGHFRIVSLLHFL